MAATNETKQHDHAEYARFSGRGSLGAMVAELERQKNTKVDFVADTRQLQLVHQESCANRPEPDRLILKPAAVGEGQVNQVGEFITGDLEVMPQALQQIGDKCTPNVPWRFLSSLADAKPGLACSLVNGMWDDPNRRLVRCLDGKVRAFLSDRYRVLDHIDLAFAALQAVQASGGEVIEANLTERHMRLKFTSRQVWDAIEEKRTSAPSSQWYAGGMGNQEHLSKVAARTGGDLPGGPGTVHPLVTVTNSETGHGGLQCRVGILRAICFNLATVESVAAQVHLGGRLEAGLFSEETISQESKVVWMKCRDAIQAAFDPAHFAKLVAKARKAQDQAIEAPGAAVAQIVEREGLDEATKDSILAHFLRDYEATAYGLAQAISRASQDVTDADKSTDLETVAGKLIAEPRMAVVA